MPWKGRPKTFQDPVAERRHAKARKCWLDKEENRQSRRDGTGFSPSLSEPASVRAHIAVHFPFPLIFPRKTVIDALGSTNVVCESDSITVPTGGPSGSA
jgi:hypothetical protein